MTSPTSQYAMAHADVTHEHVFKALVEENTSAADREPPLDRAVRARDQALRCWLEEGNAYEKYSLLSAAEKLAYKRLPVVPGSGLRSGAFFIRTYGNEAVEITAQQARKHAMFAFEAQ